MNDDDQIEQQAETIQRYRLAAHRAEKRCEIQQGMIEWQKKRIETLESQMTPEAIAERFFDGQES